jgi:hypothetical protein
MRARFIPVVAMLMGFAHASTLPDPRVTAPTARAAALACAQAAMHTSRTSPTSVGTVCSPILSTSPRRFP